MENTANAISTLLKSDIVRFLLIGLLIYFFLRLIDRKCDF